MGKYLPLLTILSCTKSAHSAVETNIAELSDRPIRKNDAASYDKLTWFRSNRPTLSATKEKEMESDIFSWPPSRRFDTEQDSLGIF